MTNGTNFDIDHGDNTLKTLNELEIAIAGNDYAFARNFMTRKSAKDRNIWQTWAALARMPSQRLTMWMIHGFDGLKAQPEDTPNLTSR